VSSVCTLFFFSIMVDDICRHHCVRSCECRQQEIVERIMLKQKNAPQNVKLVSSGTTLNDDSYIMLNLYSMFLLFFSTYTAVCVYKFTADIYLLSNKKNYFNIKTHVSVWLTRGSHTIALYQFTCFLSQTT
jgi:hypothetical protein